MTFYSRLVLTDPCREISVAPDWIRRWYLVQTGPLALSNPHVMAAPMGGHSVQAVGAKDASRSCFGVQGSGFSGIGRVTSFSGSEELKRR